MFSNIRKEHCNMEIEQPFYQCLSYKLSALLIFSSRLKSSLNVISHSEKEEQCGNMFPTSGNIFRELKIIFGF